MVIDRVEELPPRGGGRLVGGSTPRPATSPGSVSPDEVPPEFDLPEKPAEALEVVAVLEVPPRAAPPLENGLSRPPVAEGSLEDVVEICARPPVPEGFTAPPLVRFVVARGLAPPYGERGAVNWPGAPPVVPLLPVDGVLLVTPPVALPPVMPGTLALVPPPGDTLFFAPPWLADLLVWALPAAAESSTVTSPPQPANASTINMTGSAARCCRAVRRTLSRARSSITALD